MKDICKSYSTKINKNMNSLLFLYEGNKVNFDLSFKEHSNDIDRNNHQMKILVSECNEKNNLNSEKIDEIILSNKKMKDNIMNIKLQKDNVINISSNNSLNNQSKNINNILNINMLVKIKSKYISRILFSYLDEKIKLKIIKYNKKLKNNIDIKLIKYKFYTEKYIIYEDKYKGKEYDGYDNNNLVFEGEYLNGERNGKGK